MKNRTEGGEFPDERLEFVGRRQHEIVRARVETDLDAPTACEIDRADGTGAGRVEGPIELTAQLGWHRPLTDASQEPERETR